jgi:hypothetical protein
MYELNNINYILKPYLTVRLFNLIPTRASDRIKPVTCTLWKQDRTYANV